MKIIKRGIKEMAGKTKKEKRKRAKVQKRLRDELVHGNKVATKIKEMIAEEPYPDTVLEGCEIDCLTGDLIACPLSEPMQKDCKRREEWLETKELEELGNNAEPPPPNINEDAGKDAEMMVESDPTLIGEQLAVEAGLSIKFDPDQVIANLLKKKDEA